jgi:hypothetical protein
MLLSWGYYCNLFGSGFTLTLSFLFIQRQNINGGVVAGGMEVAIERVIRAIETVLKIGYIILQPNNLYDLNFTRAGLVL